MKSFFLPFSDASVRYFTLSMVSVISFILHSY
jgi:hypothetical protein